MPRIALASLLCVLATVAVGWTGTVKEGGEFLVNTYTPEDQTHADIVSDRRGNFVVVWESDDQDGSQAGIFAQRYDSAGMKVGAEFRVNLTTADQQFEPVVGMMPDGDFVVVWSSAYQDGSGFAVIARAFSSSGSPAGGEFQ